MSNVKFQLIAGPAHGSTVEVDEFSSEINVYEAVSQTVYLYKVFKICWPVNLKTVKYYFFAYDELSEDRNGAEQMAINMIAEGKVGHCCVYGGSV